MNVKFRHLFSKLQIAQDRVEAASVLLDLADIAERSPTLQEILRKIELPAPYNILKYTSPGGRRKGYWGRTPYSREHPSVAQAQARLEFSEINYSLFGTKGTVERPDGTRIALVSHLAGELMRGRNSMSEGAKADRQRQKAIERLTQVEHFR